MNTEKTKEFFTAYYEGTLERGLKESFERKLNSDGALRTEYQAFVETFKALESLKQTVPEPDYDLHDRIMARLDRHVLDEGRKNTSRSVSFWRNLSIGSVAGALLFVALYSLKYDGGLVTSGLSGPKTTVTDRLNIAWRQGEAVLSFRTGDQKKFEVVSVDSGDVLFRGTVDGRQDADGEVLRSPITTNRAESALLSISYTGISRPVLLAVPGTVPSVAKSTDVKTGSLKELALAVAGKYRVPIVLDVSDPEKTVTWTLDKAAAVDVLNSALKGSTLTCEQRQEKSIWIR